MFISYQSLQNLKGSTPAAPAPQWMKKAANSLLLRLVQGDGGILSLFAAIADGNSNIIYLIMYIYILHIIHLHVNVSMCWTQ